jgi:hypothetical protein
LHLSDLHALSPRYGWQAGEVLRALEEDLKRLEARFSIQPDILIFSGDAAFGSYADGPPIDRQFEEAWEILDRVRNAFARPIPLNHCFFVPGNHDVDRNSIDKGLQDWLESLDSGEKRGDMFSAESGTYVEKRTATMSRFTRYRDFLSRSGLNHCGVEDPALCYGTEVRIGSVNVGIAGFNSAVICSRNKEKGKLWMASAWQLNRLLPRIQHADLKIAVVHHPESWLDEREEHLFQALATKVDFVFFGHEHAQWVDPAELETGSRAKHVRVAAAALYDSNGLDQNGYSVVQWNTKDKKSTVYLREYDRASRAWGPRVNKTTDGEGRWPASAFQSSKHKGPTGKLKLTKSNRVNTGFSASQIRSGTFLQEDGDCYRTVELSDVRITTPDRAEKQFLNVNLVKTIGYVDRDMVRANVSGGQLPRFKYSCTTQRPPQLNFQFGRPLVRGDRFSVEYSWWSLNAFAMDERQYINHYEDRDMVELAQFPVLQQADNLFLYVKFPEEFVDTHSFDVQSVLSVQVSKVDRCGEVVPESRQYDVENSLRPKLCYVRELRVAFLQVTKPEPGHSYGITWRVPPAPSKSQSVYSAENRAEIKDIEDALLADALDPHSGVGERLCDFLRGVIPIFLDAFSTWARQWSGDLELSLMVFDRKSRRLKIAGVIRTRDAGVSSTAYRELHEFAFGEGVAGNAHKTDRPHLWWFTPAQDRKTPSRYVAVPGAYPYEILLSVPLKDPCDERNVFAVLNCGSNDPKCPMMGFATSSDSSDVLRDLQVTLSKLAFNVLRPQ